MKKRGWFRGKDKEDGNNHPSTGKQVAKRKNKPQKAGNLQPSTVVFVPSTKSGILAKKLRENEEKMSEKTGFKIKFQEAGGTRLEIMFSTDLGKGEHFGRSVCPPCNQNQENRQNCLTQNVLKLCA